MLSTIPSALAPGSRDVDQALAVGGALLEATLSVPLEARAIVVLLHPSSAGRFEPVARFVGEVFEQAGMATLQVDLLTPEEEATLPIDRYRHQDVSLLAQRVLGVVAWLREQRATAALRVGLFADTRVTVPALIAAERSAQVGAVVSRGGCPDFFDETLATLKAPTLVLVGEEEQGHAAELAAEFFARHLNT